MRKICDRNVYVLDKRNNVDGAGRTRRHGHSTVFRRMLRHYPFRVRILIPRRRAREPRSRRYARTHTLVRSSTDGRATRNTGSTGIKAHRSRCGTARRGAAQRNVERAVRSLDPRGLSHGHVHAPAGTRAESPTWSPASRWALWCGRRSAFAIPNTFIYVQRAPLFLSLLALFYLLLSSLMYRSIVASLRSSFSFSMLRFPPLCSCTYRACMYSIPIVQILLYDLPYVRFSSHINSALSQEGGSLVIQ